MSKKIAEYVKKRKEQKTDLGEIMERRKNMKIQELAEVELEAMIVEAKKKIRDAQATEQPLQPGQAQNYLQMLLAGRKPEEIKQILQSLDEEDIQKLALMTSAMSNNQLGMLMQVLRKPGTSVKDTIELVNTIVKTSQPPGQQGITLQGIAALMKEMRESQKPSVPPQSQVDVYDKFIKPVLDETKAMRQELAKERMSRLEKEIAELKTRPGFAEELAGKKAELEAFRDMFGGGTAPNIEMQKLGLDHEKWKIETDWRIQKELADMKLKQQSERDKMKLIEKIAVPAIKKIGPVLDAAVTAGKQKISTMGVPRGLSTKQMAKAVLCPACQQKGVQTLIPIDPKKMPDQITCPTCKTVLSKQA